MAALHVFVCSIVMVMVLWVAVAPAEATAPSLKVDRVIDVAPAWSGIPVGITLLTHGDRQFVAFYGDDRRMTVAARPLDSDRWQFVRLPQEIGWDAHNYVTMTVDDRGYLHVSGNMHAIPLVYFRSTKPYDIHSIERVPIMVGRDETRSTYPRFLRSPEDELLFTYRSGYSGNGNQIWNVYDHETQTWSRFLDEPLTHGQGQMNAYIHGPVRGPDGLYHICWVWRDHGGCETNHDLCYARSKDLRRWTQSDGTPLALPITLDTAEVVDPVPAKGGMINGNHRIGFDRRKRPVISYHKFDEDGKTQVYNARLEDGRWRIYRTTDWDYRWYFRGGGCIRFEIAIGNIHVERDGGLGLSYRHVKYGSGTWRLDEETFRPIGKIARRPTLPAELNKPESKTPGMKVRWTHDRGKAKERGVQYKLRLETLDTNRDKPRKTTPPPTMLRLYKFVPNKAALAKANPHNPKRTQKMPKDADGRPLVKKLGTIECDMVETTPIVFKGRLYRFEYVRDFYYKPNKTGKSYYRFIDVETGKPTPGFAVGYHLGSAHVEGDTVYAFGVDKWGGATMQMWWSKDLKTWQTQTALHQPGWKMYNNSVCKGPNGYVMAIELGDPPEVVGSRFTMRFAESKDLLEWRWLGPECVHTKERYSACPAIRWLEGYYYMIYLEARPHGTYAPWIARSRDLKKWELSKLNPVLQHGPEDKKIGNPNFTPEQRAHIAKAKNINNCDVDLCDFNGKTIIVYCWGNQQGTEFLAHAVYEGSVREFLLGFFP